MERFLATAVLSGVLFSPFVTATTGAQELAVSSSTVHGANLPGSGSGLPPLPSGKSTIFGGQIRSVDPVMDRFVLHVYGEKPMKVLFDERTQVYRDGVRIPLRQLAACDHASVQTTLDGTQVFAVSVHILSNSPQGDYEGQVVAYNAANGELTLGSGGNGQTFTVVVAPNTSFERKGQAKFASAQSGPGDLAKGSLVAAQFEPGKGGRGMATRITILATPGSSFVFNGNVTSLDLHAGLLVVDDPRDDKSYQIHFDPSRISEIQNLHVGDHVRVDAEYDGSHYVANNVAHD